MTHDHPSPETVRQLCARRMWDDAADDESRLILELAADTIRELMARAGSASLRAERAEAERDTLRQICYGPQKGGAA
jgi:hypothetical protein